MAGIKQERIPLLRVFMDIDAVQHVDGGVLVDVEERLGSDQRVHLCCYEIKVHRGGERVGLESKSGRFFVERGLLDCIQGRCSRA